MAYLPLPVAPAAILPDRIVMLGARLIGDRDCRAMQQVNVPRRGHADGLGEDGGDAGTCRDAEEEERTRPGRDR